MSLRDRRFGLPRANHDLSRFQSTAPTQDTDDSDAGGGYYDSEEEEERALSRRHGEAQETEEPSAGEKRKKTDEEIAAEYNDSKKVKQTNRVRRKTIDEKDLIQAKGLSTIFTGFPHNFHQRQYKKNRTDMARFSSQLISAYQQWANGIVPGTPLEEVLWKLDALHRKTSVKCFLQTMRHKVRDQHVERIYGLEKAEQMIAQLEEGYEDQDMLPMEEEQQLPAAASGSDESATELQATAAVQTGTGTATTAPSSHATRTVNDTSTPEEDHDDIPDVNDMIPVQTARHANPKSATETEEEEILDMNDWMPVHPEEDEYSIPEDMDDMLVYNSTTSKPITAHPPSSNNAPSVNKTNPVTTSQTPSVGAKHAKIFKPGDEEDEDSTDEEELIFDKAPRASSIQRAVMEDSDDEQKETKHSDFKKTEEPKVENLITKELDGSDADKSEKTSRSVENTAIELETQPHMRPLDNVSPKTNPDVDNKSSDEEENEFEN